MKQVIKLKKEEDIIKKIYKYNLPHTTGVFDLFIPPIYNILKIDIQNEKPIFWAIVYSQEPKKRYRITSVWTGMEYKEEFGTYLGTLTINELVYHYFIREVYDGTR